MDTKEIVAFLHNVPIFKNLSNRQLESLSKLAYEREYPAESVIVKQGENGIGLFVVVSGSAEAIRERQDGVRVVVNSFKATDFFGELALLDEGERTASVVTKEPTRCLGIARWDFLSFLKNDPEMAVTILQELGRRFRTVLEASL